MNGEPMEPPATEVPVLTSARLILRAFQPGDVEPMLVFYGSDISRFYGGPISREEAWRKLAMYPGHWALRGWGPWALAERESGDFVGIAGMWFPDGWHAPEITWALLEPYHGRGYATEGARRALQAAYEVYGWSSAVSVIAAGNDASVAVATRLGATFEERITNRYGAADVYRHVSPDGLAGD